MRGRSIVLAVAFGMALANTAWCQDQEPTQQQKLSRIWVNEPPLVRLARDHFGADLTETDAQFFAAVAENGWADFRPSSDTEYDQQEISSWNESTQLPGDRIAWLCTDPAAAKLVPSRGIWLRGVSVQGSIDLYRSEIPFSLTFYDCLLTHGINLGYAKLQELDLEGCCTAAIAMRGSEVAENVYLRECVVFNGVNLIDAQVAGDFDFQNGYVLHGIGDDTFEETGIALNMHDAKIGGDVKLSDEFRAVGQVRLLGTQIGRGLSCSGGYFSNAGGKTIYANRCRVAGNVTLDDDFQSAGPVYFSQAHIDGNLDCEGATLIAEDDAPLNLNRTHVGGDFDCDSATLTSDTETALSADFMKVGRQVYLGKGFTSNGEVRLIDAEIAGDVDCDNGHFIHPDGDALSLDGATIGRTVHLGMDWSARQHDDEDTPGFLARGTVRMFGTKVGQDITSSGGEFIAPTRNALILNNMQVGSRIVMSHGCYVQGTTHLSAVEIGRDLDLRDSYFDASQVPGQIAIQADGLQVDGHFRCDRLDAEDPDSNFRVDGKVILQFATIGKHWDLYGAQFYNPGGDVLDASDSRIVGYVNLDSVVIDGRVNFSRAHVENMWVWINIEHPEDVQLDLRFAHFWVLKDEKLTDWPTAGQLQLEGLVYDHFDDDSTLSVHDRIAWLRRQYPPLKSTLADVPPPEATATAHSMSEAPPADMEVDAEFAVASYGAIEEESEEADVADDRYGSVDDAPEMAVDQDYENFELEEMSIAPEAMSIAPEKMSISSADELADAADQPADLTPPDVADPTGRRYVTQPYTQLASVYRAIGQDQQAAQVLVARAERLGELALPLSAEWWWYRYLGKLIGYGYEPFRAVKIGAGIILLGALVFALGARRKLMTQTKLFEHVFNHEEGQPQLTAAYHPFNPLVYSLDVFLPFIDLKQVCYWLPGEKASGGSRNCLMHVGPMSLHYSTMLRIYLWFQTLAGWTLTTLLAAAVTGIVKN